MFPPNMRPEQHVIPFHSHGRTTEADIVAFIQAYTILESSTDSVFLHMTTSEPPSPYWGNILKSNWNGTYYGLSIENVNRDERGYVDFEKMIGLDGIALINVVGNPGDAAVTGAKKLQTRITHNDGECPCQSMHKEPNFDVVDRWLLEGSYSSESRFDGQQVQLQHRSTFLFARILVQADSNYPQPQNCALHVHGYTERADPRATFSSPSVVGLIMAVGNVGEDLVGYTDSDTFLSRDAGFTWEEVHKDAHLWEFGDSGSILIMANDEEPTDHVLFTTDEGLNWREYTFTDEKLRVTSIVTVPSDTSRRFILMGQSSRGTVAVHLDFTSLTTKR